MWRRIPGGCVTLEVSIFGVRLSQHPLLSSGQVTTGQGTAQPNPRKKIGRTRGEEKHSGVLDGYNMWYAWA